MKIGDTFKNPFKHKRPKCHVRAIIDEQVVFRWYSRSKRMWLYECENHWILEKFVKVP